MSWIGKAVRSERTTRWVTKAIFLVGVPAGIVAGLEVSGPWHPPDWLFYTSALAAAVILVAAIVVAMFGKIE